MGAITTTNTLTVTGPNFRAGAYRVAHDLLPGRVLQRAYATVANDGDDAGCILPGRGLAGAAASLLGGVGRRPGRAGDAGEAASDGVRRGENGSDFREVAARGLEETSSGGGGSGGGESGRHGRR